MFEPEIFRKQMYCIEESICDFMGPPAVIWRAGNSTPLGHFRYGVERAKRFVNVHLHCTVTRQQHGKDKQNIEFAPLEKFLRTSVLLS